MAGGGAAPRPGGGGGGRRPPPPAPPPPASPPPPPARAGAPARTPPLIISDVEGDDPADIASGPCTPDEYTAHDVIGLLQRTGLYARVPASMREYLGGVVRGVTPETPKRTHPAFAHVATRVIGSNRLSTHAAAKRAEALRSE